MHVNSKPCQPCHSIRTLLEACHSQFPDPRCGPFKKIPMHWGIKLAFKDVLKQARQVGVRATTGPQPPHCSTAELPTALAHPSLNRASEPLSVSGENLKAAWAEITAETKMGCQNCSQSMCATARQIQFTIRPPCAARKVERHHLLPQERKGRGGASGVIYSAAYTLWKGIQR